MSTPRRPLGLLAALALAAPAHAAEPTPAQQSLADAWWTGPMLAPGAGTLPHGHWLVEPYLFDVRGKGADTLGSLTYVNHGLTDRLTVGVIPVFFFNRGGGARDSSQVGAGDLTLSAQYRLTQYRQGGAVPTTSIVLQEVLPTGKYDRLGGRPNDGFGAGAFATLVGVYAQTYAWMPNGRILRLRLDTSATVSASASVKDDSVYGTLVGFRGRARPGDELLADAAAEYSATKNWVLALDLVYRHDAPTRVSGRNAAGAHVRFDGASHDSFAVAPAVEYNWSPNVGALLGVRLIPAMSGRPASVTPAVALNYFY